MSVLLLILLLFTAFFVIPWELIIKVTLFNAGTISLDYMASSSTRACFQSQIPRDKYSGPALTLEIGDFRI